MANKEIITGYCSKCGRNHTGACPQKNKTTCSICSGNHSNLDCPNRRDGYGVEVGGCFVCGKNPCICTDYN